MDFLNSSALALMAGSFFGSIVGIAGYHSRNLQQISGSVKKRWGYFAAGTLAGLFSLASFLAAFSFDSIAGALAITFIFGAWIGLLNTNIELTVPNCMKKVSMLEFKIYKFPVTGVSLFGYLLKNTALRKLGGDVFIKGNGRGLSKILQGLQAAEAVHFWSFVVMIPFLFCWSFLDELSILSVVIIVILFLHLFPVAHIRMVRFRIEKLEQKRK